MDEIAVVGCGAIGLPFAAALASRSLRVTGFDVDSARIAQLKRGVGELVDDGLDLALRNALDARTLRFVDRLDRMDRGRTFVIAVPTPIDSSERFDSRPLDAAIAAIENVARDDDLVVLRSTTPIGTLRRYAARLGRLAFAACPDRTVAGRAFVEQFSIPHLVGGLDAAATARAAGLLTKLGRVICVATPEVAEAAKLFANVWRDAHFALANQLALFCEQAGLDYDEVRAAAAESFPRFDAPRAGPVAGPCLAKDVFLLAGSGEVPLLVEARRLNVQLVDKIADRLLRELAPLGGPARVAVLGLAYKGVPSTRDQRSSAAIKLIERLKALRSDLEVVGWDPVCDAAAGAATALTGAAAVVLANDHPALAETALYSSCAQGALLYDLCGVLRRTADLRPDIALRRFGQGELA